LTDLVTGYKNLLQLTVNFDLLVDKCLAILDKILIDFTE